MDPKPSVWKYFFAVLAIVAIAVLAALALQQQQQIKQLRNEDTSAETKKEVKAEDQSQAPANGERQLITMPYNELGKCEENQPRPVFNNDPANTTATFSNREYGFEVTLPFNEKWGTDRYKLEPYEFDDNERVTLWYGPIGGAEGCGWVRQGIGVKDPQTEAEVIAELKKNFGSDPEDFTFGPEVVNADGFKMVRYSADGICTFQGIIVLGKRHAYEFSTCNDDRNEAFREFNKIISTLKSI